MKRTKQQLVEENTSLKQQLSLANEQHNNVVDELNKLRSSCVSKSTYDDLYEDCERHIKHYNDCTDKYHSKCDDYKKLMAQYEKRSDDYNKLNADKANQIDNLQSQIRKLEHDHAACITREQYNKLEVQLASVTADYEELIINHEAMLNDRKSLSTALDKKIIEIADLHDRLSTAIEERDYYTLNSKDLYQKVADMNKSNKWLLYSLVASLGALMVSLIW